MTVYKLVCILLLSPLISGESTLIPSTQTEVEDDALTDVTVSVGIKSFTVEVTKPTTRSTNASIFDKSIEITDKYDSNHLSTLSNIPEGYHTTELVSSTEFLGTDTTIITQNPPSYNLSENRENISSQPEFEEENTDERPPASSSIFSGVTIVTTSSDSVDSTSTPEPMINDIHVEKKLENGLYRIKLAEITTDEFSGGNANFPVEQEEARNQPKPQPIGGKINIVDFYPSKLEDFVPLIKESNDKIIKDKQMYFNDDKNMMPNSLNELFEDDSNIPTSKIEIELIDGNESNQRSTEIAEKITDFTGKLQERDGVITEIEKKFRLDDLKQSTPKPVTVNHKIDFIDRRVKKSFDFPPNNQYGRFSTIGRIDFANTKFNTDSTKKDEKAHSDKPEFSTTKFYNSKELYNEMLHKKLNSDQNGMGESRHTPMPQPLTTMKTKVLTDTTSQQLQSKMFFVTYPSSKKEEETTSDAAADLLTSKYLTHDANLKTTLPTPSRPLPKTKVVSKFPQKNSLPSTESVAPSSPMATRVTMPSIAALTTNNSPKTSAVVEEVSRKQNFQTSRIPSRMSTSEQTTPLDMSTTTISQSDTTNPRIGLKAAAILKARKPFSRPRVLTRLQEKINSLECDIQNVPQDSHLWRGNETHELLLPITTPENCKTTDDCLPMVISWEGQAEIQSGDVLLVEINDALLSPVDSNYTQINNTHKATTRVYQVTRPGHEHCDVTEGVLLDITPLVVDGKKLVTLYDKDLTEGINLLIVVSELWGSQCVRLKVTVKSDNCGENADCSTKGVCFSNESMEGYECQCCSGFAGPHCEEIDACSPSPCTNNGICVDLSQGHEGNAYQCLCPYGYTGKNCQYESDPCNPAECMNGGSCVGNSTHFRCDCAPGYTGPLCQHNLNECESSPCVHGICVDQEDGFRCFCQPGFAGELCNFEYNECESTPCLNGGQCIDQIGGFECRCTHGYRGNQCHIKVDFCANGPCPEGHRCIDHGDEFTCECPGGRNGPDCDHVPRTLCNVNSCENGGTCWTSEESFYCACRPGYTGKMCEDEFVVETVVSSSEFMIDDTSARSGFSDKTFGSVVIKSPIELHNAYIAAGTLAAAIFIVAIVVTICHCKVHQTYRRFSTRHHQLIPIFGFGKRIKSPKSHRHWLSGKGGGGGGGGGGGVGVGGNVGSIKPNKGHLPGTVTNQCHSHHIGGNSAFHHQHTHQIHDRPFQRHLAMNLENDMYYTVDFSDSQHSPLIQ